MIYLKLLSFVVFIMVKLTLKSELSNKLRPLFPNRNNIQFDVFKSAIGKCSIPLVGRKIIPIPYKYYLVIGRLGLAIKLAKNNRTWLL